MNVGLLGPVDPPAAPQKQALDEAETKAFASFGSGCLAFPIGSRRSLGEPVRDIADRALKQALANFEHQFDAFEARAGYQPKTSQPPCPASTDPQIAFANEVAAMKTRLTEDRAAVSMRHAVDDRPKRRPWRTHALGAISCSPHFPLAQRELFPFAIE